MEHLEKLYRRHLAKESVQPPSVAAARLSIGESVAFASPGQNPVAVFHENVSQRKYFTAAQVVSARLLIMVASMDPRSLQYIAKACAGEQLTGCADTLVRRVCTDSRAVRAGDIFFALSGDKFDGHDFLKEVMGKDAAAVVVNRQRLPVPPLACGDDRRGRHAAGAGAFRRGISSRIFNCPPSPSAARMERRRRKICSRLCCARNFPRFGARPVSTMTLACRSRCCAWNRITKRRCSKSAPIIPVNSRRWSR